MRNTTDEFSFRLKPSTIPGAGVGVFAMHDIAAGTELAVRAPGDVDILRKREEVPESFWNLTEHTSDGMLRTPQYFNRVSIEAYINHSKQPNCVFRAGEGSGHFALRDIREGEEIFLDYVNFDEPEHMRESFYAH